MNICEHSYALYSLTLFNVKYQYISWYYDKSVNFNKKIGKIFDASLQAKNRHLHLIESSIKKIYILIYLKL